MIFANIIFPAPAYVYVLGFLAWPITILLMIAECVIVWKINKINFLHASAYTLAANLFSTALGLLIIFTINLPSEFNPGDERWTQTREWLALAKLSVMVCLILSIIAEGAFYRLVKCTPRIAFPWRSALWANVASYSVILAFTLPQGR